MGKGEIFPRGYVFAAGFIGVAGDGGTSRERARDGRAQTVRPHRKSRGVSAPADGGVQQGGRRRCERGQGKWPDTGTPYGGCRLTGAGENLPVKIPRRAGWRGKSNDNPQPLYCKGDGSRRPPCSIFSFPKGRSDAIASVFVLSSAAAGAVRWKRRRPPA